MTVNPMEWLSYIHKNPINSSHGKICTFFTIYTYGMLIIVSRVHNIYELLIVSYYYQEFIILEVEESVQLPI